MAKNLSEAVIENLNHIEGIDDILGQFYYVREPEELRKALERWLIHTPEGRNWLDSLGFISKEAVIKVIEQIETNLEQTHRDLVTKIQLLRSHVDTQSHPGKKNSSEEDP